MNETYLIFERGAHSVINFVQASSAREAIWHWISEERSQAVLQTDGSIEDEGLHYPHPLAFVEARRKIYAEWQIRRLPAWVWQGKVVEAFCGESDDGPAAVIASCRKPFAKAFPRSRAKAFVWYLKQGTLVTFYRRRKPFTIEVLKRYLYNWDGEQETIEEWEGDYEQIITNLVLEPYLLA